LNILLKGEIKKKKMDNKEILATLGIKYTGRRQKKTTQHNTDGQHGPNKNTMVNPCAREV
jgi:hypothetical protein